MTTPWSGIGDFLTRSFAGHARPIDAIRGDIGRVPDLVRPPIIQIGYVESIV
jgi:hypothetical protein